MVNAIRSKLAANILFGFLVALILFALITGVIGYKQFTEALDDHYADNGYRIARLASELVDRDNLDSYLDEDYMQTEEYKTAMRRLDVMTQDLGPAFIYILQPNNEDCTEVTFLFETVNRQFDLTPYEPGYVREASSEEYAQKYKLIMEGKSEQECVFRGDKDTITGAHVTALVPVKNSKDEVVGIMCVQRQMEALKGARNKFLRNIALATLILVLLVTALYGNSLTTGVARPIRRIAAETVRFSRENVLPAVSLTETTRGRDEIKLLAMHVDKMEYAIMNYTENLKAVTSQKDRMQGELNVASTIQHAMIPHQFPPFPERDEFDLYASMDAAKEVGGDFYDFFFVDDDHLALVIADVSGKGAPAALFMMAAKIFIKSRALNGGTPGEILADVNRSLAENNESNMFVTTWLGILDVSTGELVTANAGHEYPAICRADGSFELVKDKHGFVLGGINGSRYQNETFELQPGDCLFVYTDGVTEAADAADALFGTDQMLSALNASRKADPETLLTDLSDHIRTFTGDREQADDITMMALRYHGRQSHLRTMTIEAKTENLGEVIGWVEEMMNILDVPMKTQMQINLAVEEIFVNIANYAYAPGVGDVTIRMGYDMDTHTVKLAFLDKGTPYDPLAKEDPDTQLSAEDREIGGLGIFLVKQTMDKISYRRANNMNVLTLEKKSDNPLADL